MAFKHRHAPTSCMLSDSCKR